MNDCKNIRFLLLIVGFFCMMLLGLVYAWSIFSDYLSLAAGVPPSLLSSVFGVLMIFFCVGCLVASFAQRKISVRGTILVSAFFVLVGFLGTSLTASEGVVCIYICYGIFVGLGCGFGYNSIVSTVNSWYSDKVGFSSGVLLLGYGSGALVFGTLAQKMMESQLGCLGTLAVIGVFLACILILASFVIKKPPKNTSANVKSSVGKRGMTKTSFSPSQMIKSRIFHLQIVWYICSAVSPVVLLGTAKQGAVSVGVSPEFAVILVGVTSVANGVSRIAYGLVFDKRGLTAVMRTCTSLALLGCLSITISFACSISGLYVVGALGLGLAYGGAPICSSTFSMVRFGMKYYPTNYAIATSCMIPTAAIQVFVMPLVVGSVGAVGQYAVLSIVAVVGLGVLSVFSGVYKREMNELV